MLSPAELADRWCDSCGKKLPLSFQPPTKGSAPTPAATEPETGSTRHRPLIWFGVILAVIGVAILIFQAI